MRDLQLNAAFHGIILNLYPQDSDQLPGGSSCGNNRGIMTNNGQNISGWAYALGGNSSTPGIVLRENPDDGTKDPIITNFNGNWNFFNDAFTNAPPTSFKIKGWRELYQ